MPDGIPVDRFRFPNKKRPIQNVCIGRSAGRHDDRSRIQRALFAFTKTPAKKGSDRRELLDPVLDAADKRLEIGIGRKPGGDVLARVNNRCMIAISEFSAN